VFLIVVVFVVAIEYRQNHDDDYDNDNVAA